MMTFHSKKWSMKQSKKMFAHKLHNLYQYILMNIFIHQPSIHNNQIIITNPYKVIDLPHTKKKMNIIEIWLDGWPENMHFLDSSHFFWSIIPLFTFGPNYVSNGVKQKKLWNSPFVFCNTTVFEIWHGRKKKHYLGTHFIELLLWAVKVVSMTQLWYILQNRPWGIKLSLTGFRTL